MGHFSVEIYAPTGSLLSGNQHLCEIEKQMSLVGRGASNAIPANRVTAVVGG